MSVSMLVLAQVSILISAVDMWTLKDRQLLTALNIKHTVKAGVTRMDDK